MTAYDMIILGLGPAGAYLGHRAKARGLKVLGIDPAEKWSATYGGWTDELADAPLVHSEFPSVRFGVLGYRLDREYSIIDGDAWRSQLLDFEVIQATGEVLSSNKVKANGQDFLAEVVVDARGTAPTPPVQQALGWFIEDAPTTWMDWDNASFLYSFPTAKGHLVEETVLATSDLRDWQELEDKLRRRFPNARVSGTERVLISLGGSDTPGPALRYGARAGFVNPISGFSVGTSISLAEPTLDALFGTGILPWRRRTFRIDHALALRLQQVLLTLEPVDTAELMKALLRSPCHRRFLTLGDVTGTLLGMAWVFTAVPWRTKKAIAWAMAKNASV